MAAMPSGQIAPSPDPRLSGTRPEHRGHGPLLRVPCRVWTVIRSVDLDHVEIVLAHAAVRTGPVLGYIRPARARRDAFVGQAIDFAVQESANHAHPCGEGGLGGVGHQAIMRKGARIVPFPTRDRKLVMNARWTRERPLPSGLYLITPQEADTERLLARVIPLLGHGVTWLQYRDKSGNHRLRLAQARTLAAACAVHAIPLIINDDAALAHAVGAAGVHLGEDDGAIAAARALLGDGALIGASCYDRLDLAQAAVDAGADYVAFGAFHPSSSKQGTRRADPALLQAARYLPVPRVAIGGITPDNAPALVAAGADLVAVIGSVFDADDPKAAVHAYRRAFQHRGTGGHDPA